MSVSSLERAATTLSIVCAVECLLLPVATIALPLGSAALPLPEGVELGAIAFALALSAFMFVRGYASHRKRRYLATLVVAAGLFAVAHRDPSAKNAHFIGGASSLFLATAQLGNRRRMATACSHAHGDGRP